MGEIIWAIAIKSKITSGELELPTAICSCFQQLGYKTSLVRDGDRAGLEADVLLLLVTLGDYPVYCQKLKQCGSQRPVTILWQIDPLPPEDSPPQAESAGLKASRWRDFFCLYQPTDMPRWKKLCTLYRLRVWGYKQFSAPGFRKACRLIKHHRGGDFHWTHIRGVMENWQSILDSHNEGWIDHFAVSTNQRKNFLVHRGIAAYFIPVGAHEYMGCDMGLQRDIPVGFIGSTRQGRRAAIVDSLGDRLKKKGIPLIQTEKGYYGEQRCKWLNRTRILINLYNYSWSSAWIRFLMAAKCRTLVVSEPMNDEHPMIAGIHYVSATLDEMPEVICNLLDDPVTIDRITSAAAMLCQHELTLLHAVGKLIKLHGITKPDKTSSSFTLR
jgi:hypothetical protein